MAIKAGDNEQVRSIVIMERDWKRAKRLVAKILPRSGRQQILKQAINRGLHEMEMDQGLHGGRRK